MLVNPSIRSPDRDSDTRLALKRVARSLMAERGVRSVTVREIAQAAAQRNQGVVAYYFGTKENLLAEILVDGAERIEARRRPFIDRMASNGGPHTIAEVVAAIVLPSAEFVDQDEEYGRFFNRFLFRVTTFDPVFVDQALAGRYSEGYQRCLSLLRGLMTAMPRQIQSRRFIFLSSYISALLAQREAVMADSSADHPSWGSADTLEDIVRTAAAILETPHGSHANPHHPKGSKTP